MKYLYPTKTYSLGLFLIFLVSFSAFAQVGINTVTPADGSLLDINSTEKGVFIPKVDIINLATILPITGVTGAAAELLAEGLLVYNTNATSGPGYFYWDGTDWVAVGDGDGDDDWKITGNTGTVAGTNFLGTRDNISLELFTNNTTRMRVEDDGQVSIGFGATGVNANQQFNVGTSFTDGTAIGGYSGNAGIGVYGQNISNGYGVWGLNNSNGRGVYGTNSSTGQGVRGYNSGTGWGVGARAIDEDGFGLVSQNSSTTGTAVLASGANLALTYWLGSGGVFNGSTTGAIGNAKNANGTGVAGVGNSGTMVSTLTDGSGVAGVGDTGLYGTSNGTNGTGIIGVGGDVGGDTSAITTNNTGSGISGSGLTMGVFGYAGNGDVDGANEGNAGGEFTLDADNDPTTNSGDNGNRARAILAGYNDVTPDGSLVSNNSYYGGYFSGGSESSGTPSYAYVGMRYRTNNEGDGVLTGGGPTQDNGQDYKIIGTGLVSTLINDSENKPRVLFAPEAPEIVFQDFGVGKLISGQVRILLDPVLKGSLHIDNEHPLKVYVTLEGDCNGIYVTDKSANGFTVKELQGGTSNVSFSWQIVASRADTKDSSGKITSKHVGVRLPIGPGPIGSELKKLEKKEETAKEVKDDSKDVSVTKSVESKLESAISEKKN